MASPEPQRPSIFERLTTFTRKTLFVRCVEAGCPVLYSNSVDNDNKKALEAYKFPRALAPKVYPGDAGQVMRQLRRGILSMQDVDIEQWNTISFSGDGQPWMDRALNSRLRPKYPTIPMDGIPKLNRHSYPTIPYLRKLAGDDPDSSKFIGFIGKEHTDVLRASIYEHLSDEELALLGNMTGAQNKWVDQLLMERLLIGTYANKAWAAWALALHSCHYLSFAMLAASYGLIDSAHQVKIENHPFFNTPLHPMSPYTWMEAFEMAPTGKWGSQIRCSAEMDWTVSTLAYKINNARGVENRFFEAHGLQKPEDTEDFNARWLDCGRVTDMESLETLLISARMAPAAAPSAAAPAATFASTGAGDSARDSGTEGSVGAKRARLQ